MPKRRKLLPEDVLAFRTVDDVQISPDGSQVAFRVGDSFKLDSKWPKSTIWTVDAAGGSPRQLTGGPRTDSLPRWSPDGSRLAFLSDRLREGHRQVFLLAADGGEALPLTDIDGKIPTPRGLNALQWSPDGRQLAFSMEDAETDDERRRRDSKDDAIAFEQDPKYVRLWTVDVETRAVRCVSPDGVQIWEFAWSPDSRQFAAVASDAPFEWAWYTNRVVRFEPGAQAQTVWQSSRQVAFPVWSPDAGQIAFISSNWSDRNCVAGDVWLVDAKGGQARDLTKGVQASFGWIDWSEGDTLLAIGHERGGIGLHLINTTTTSEGTSSCLWWQAACVAEAFWPRFSRAVDGTVALALEDTAHPRDIWIGRPGDTAVEWRQLTHLHPQAEEFELGDISFHEWVGADGWPMQGLLVKPVGYKPGKSCPLVMHVHGGPTGVSAARYYAAFGWVQLMAAAGYAVFLPNYRGSVGWGLEFAESNLGDMGGKDFDDMLLGVDSLVDCGLADPDRLAIAGWSYGGFTAAWAVARSTRFRAAVMGAGISHWLSFHGRSSLSAWDAIHYQASAYDPQGPFQKFSPLAYYNDLQTPTLILHGEVDQDVPVEQSYLFYRALKDKGVPTELIVYPREEHAVTERAHQLDLSRRVLAWLARYLGADNEK